MFTTRGSSAYIRMFGLVTHTIIRIVVLSFFLLIVPLQVEWGLDAVFAETWVCPRPGQSDLYTDHRGAGCSELSEAKSYSTLSIAPKSAGPPLPAAGSRLAAPIASVSAPGTEPKKPSPFSDVSLFLPIVAVSQPNPGAISGLWLGLVAWLTVGYAAHGTGPEIVTDGNLHPVSLRSLQTAAVVAATAVGYNPKFLKVRLLTPTVVDGPSAGGMYAVGIASALLGDAIRQDVCMSGTIEPTFEIKPVGGLADKMNACKTLNKTTMIVPDGLDNSHLSFQGAERAIHVIEVHTLGEAYAAATGQVLRHIPPL
jgi:hypothetical protein